MCLLIQPNYSLCFRCIAGKCTDTCCQGWEIDIDDVSARKYASLESPIGEIIRANVFEDKYGAHFRLLEQDRCPFLRADGLCEMILKGGENMLCEICREHPRFYNRIGSRLEMGYGLCCEEACRLLCSYKTGIALVAPDESPTDVSEDDPLATAVVGARELLFNIIRDRTQNIFTRMERMSEKLSSNKDKLLLTDNCEPTWQMFASLEPLDDTWLPLVERIRSDASLLQEAPDVPEYLLENLLFYFTYRYFPKVYTDGYSPAACAGFAILSVRFITAALCLAQRENGALSLCAVINVIKNYSKQVEYCEENVAALLDCLED